MSEKNNPAQADQATVNQAIGIWEKYSKKIIYVSSAVILVVGGYLAYANFVQAPKETKASEELFAAEANFRKDSFNLALNGANGSAGFLKVISKYGGTDAGNLACLYAGECHLQLGEYQKAIDQLEKFNASGAKQVEAKVEGLLGDALAELKKNDEAIGHYKKAGTIFPEDQALASEYLFRCGLLCEVAGKNDEAIECYQIIKNKYPRTEKGFIVDKYLARLGSVK